MHPQSKRNSITIAVSGAVKCLGMMVEDLPEGELLDLAATVLPELVQLVGAEGCPPGLQRQALRVFNCTVQSLEYMHRTHPGAKELLTSSLPGWLSAINAVISAPTTAQLASFWGVKFEALGCLIHLIPPFANLTGEHLHPCMTSTWGMVVSVLPLYCQVVVCGEDEDVEFGDAADGPDGAVPLPDLVSQLFELVITMAGHRRLGKFIRPSYQELAYLTLGYAQMAEEDVMRWAADVNAYLGEEDDLWGPRSSVEILLDEILDAGEKVGAHALAEAVRRRAEEAAAAKASGKEEWWKLREAVLFGLGAAADRIVEQKMAGKALPSQLDPDIIIPSLFAEDLAAGAPPFVAGRALWLLSKLSQVVPHSCRPAALAAVAAAFAPGTPAAVQAGACQAMSKLCKRAAPGDVAVVSETAFAGLCTLLPNAAEDALHLVLETLTALVAADPGAAARWEPHLTPSALKAWVDNVNDPLVGVDATDLLQALANVPGCLPPLQSRALPTLIDAIRNPGHHSGILVSGCLDMLIMLLAPSQPEAAQAVCAAAIPPTLSLLSSSDDEEVLASATALLRTALQVGKEAAMGWWGQDPAAAMATLLQAVDRLLQPTLPDRACRHVGGVILEMLRYAASLLVSCIWGFMD